MSTTLNVLRPTCPPANGQCRPPGSRQDLAAETIVHAARSPAGRTAAGGVPFHAKLHLAAGLRHDPDIRSRRLPTLRIGFLGVVVGHRAGDDHVLAMLPVDGS